MHKCDYCKIRDAKFKMTSGKWCCESFYTKCPKIKERISSSNTGIKNPRYGKKLSAEHKKILSNTHKGKVVSKESRLKMSNTKKEMYENGELKGLFKPGQISYFKGKIRPEMKGNNNPAKRPEVRKKISEKLKLEEYNLSKAKNQDVIEKIRSKAIDRFKDKMWVEKFREACSLKPNNLELEMEKLLFKLNTKFEYVGDFSFWVNGKNPDFINKESNKIIELFGDYWHSSKFTGVSKTEHVKIITDHYIKNGYDILIIWESELLQNIESVIEKVNKFNSM